MSACTCVWLTPGTSYSTGSSTVMIRRSGRLIRRMKAVSEVDLPEPVGPVTSTIPCGAARVRVTFSSSSSVRPSSRIESGFDFWLRRRKLTLSPYIVGKVEMRMSSSVSPAPNEMRPSCGRRFSEMLSFAMILRREMIASWKRIKLSGTRIATSSPSIR